MSEFEENSRVIISEGELAGASGTIRNVSSECCNVETDDGDLALIHESKLKFEDMLDEPNGETFYSVDDYLAKMSIIALTNKINIAVSPEPDHLNTPYFKVYDNGKIFASEKVARLHFKGSGIEIHNRDRLGKQPWIPDNQDIKDIQTLLKEPAPALDNLYTVWQVLCYEWNRLNGLIPFNTTMKEYVSGKHDNQRFNDASLKEAYVPSTQEIPETWN